MRSTTTLIATLTLTALTGACMAPTGEQDDEHIGCDHAAFATPTGWSTSILNDLQQASVDQGSGQIDYPACVYRDDGGIVGAATREDWRGVLEDQINIWNDHLQGQPGWDVTDINLVLVGSGSACPSQHTFASGQQPLRVLRVRRRDSSYATRSASEVRINIKTTTFDGPATSDNGIRVTAHEYGHLIGLLDTYLSGREMSPMSIMAKSKVLPLGARTADDVDGMRHLWARNNGQTSAACPADYEEVPDGRTGTYCQPLHYRISNVEGDRDRCVAHYLNTASNLWRPMLGNNCNFTNGKKVWFSPSEDAGFFKVGNAARGTGMCWQADSSGVITFQTCGTTDAQDWQITLDQSDRTYVVTNKQFAGCLEMPAIGSTDLRLNLKPCNGSDAQKWRLWNFSDNLADFGHEADFE